MDLVAGVATLIRVLAGVGVAAGCAAVIWLMWWLPKHRSQLGDRYVASRIASPDPDRLADHGPEISRFPMFRKEPDSPDVFGLDPMPGFMRRRVELAHEFDDPTVVLRGGTLIIDLGPARRAVVPLARVSAITAGAARELRRGKAIAYFTQDYAWLGPGAAVRIDLCEDTEVLIGRVRAVRSLLLQVSDTEAFVASLRNATSIQADSTRLADVFADRERRTKRDEALGVLVERCSIPVVVLTGACVLAMVIAHSLQAYLGYLFLAASGWIPVFAFALVALDARIRRAETDLVSARFARLLIGFVAVLLAIAALLAILRPGWSSDAAAALGMLLWILGVGIGGIAWWLAGRRFRALFRRRPTG